MNEQASSLTVDRGTSFQTASSSLIKLGGRVFSRTALFSTCLALVMAVSVHDTMLIILNRDLINEFEENPVGRWLLQLQGGDVWLFVFVKLLCTSIVTTVVATLFRYRENIGLAVAVGLALFQSGLLIYLTFS